MNDRLGLFDRAKSRQMCEDLSLARNIPEALRNQARHTLYSVAWNAKELFPSFTDRRLSFCPPPGWRPMNHSVTRWGDRLVTALRCTNYLIDDRGPRMIEQTPNFSRTFLVDLSLSSFCATTSQEIFLPDPVVERIPGVPAGFEDARIFVRGNELHAIFVRCDMNEKAWTEQWTGKIVGDTISNPRKLKSPDPQRAEKNWMPAVVNDEIWYVYSCDPVVLLNESCLEGVRSTPSIAADHFRGSSQLVFTKSGASLALIHTCTIHKLWPKNLFRFVEFDGGIMTAVSDAFRFPDRYSEEYLRGYQYAMGLCWHPDGKRLLISYSLGDGQSRLGVVDAKDVTSVLREI